MNRVDFLRKIFPDAEHYGAQAAGVGFIASLAGHDSSFKRIPAANLRRERSVNLNSTFLNIVTFRHLRPATWKCYAEGLLAFREAVNDGFRKLYRAWVTLMAEPVPSEKAVAKLPLKDLESIFRLARTIPPLPCVAVDEWGLASESSAAKKKTKALQVLRRYDTWLRASRSFASGVREVLVNLNDFTATYLSCRKSESLDQEAANGRLLLVNLASAWEQLTTVQLEFRDLFGKFSSELSLSRLEEFEQINFRHLWSTAFGMQHVRDRSIRNANLAIWEGIAERRTSFLKALQSEIETVMGSGSSEVRHETWEANGHSNLLIVCDHDSIEDSTDIRSEISVAIWKAAQSFEWRDHEWTPLTIEWHSFAILHLVQGKLLEPAAVFIPSITFFVGNDFEVRPHHVLPLPIAEECVLAAGLTIWDKPLVRAAMALEKTLTVHLMNCDRVPEVLDLFSEAGVEPEDIEERLLSFTNDLCATCASAQTDFAILSSILETLSGDHAITWREQLTDLCEIRLRLNPEICPITQWEENFSDSFDQIHATNEKWQHLLAAMIMLSISAPR